LFINTLLGNLAYPESCWEGYLPDAYCIDASEKLITLLEIEQHSPLTAHSGRVEAIIDLFWRLDYEGWGLNIVTVNKKTLARCTLSHSEIGRMAIKHDNPGAPREVVEQVMSRMDI